LDSIGITYNGFTEEADIQYFSVVNISGSCERKKNTPLTLMEMLMFGLEPNAYM